MKRVKAVQPFKHKGYLNFKLAPFNSWVKNGGMVARSLFPPSCLHGLTYKFGLPTFPLPWKKDAVLMFVEPVSITFDTFPYCLSHEIIPLFWDCWPSQYEKVVKWIKRYNVKTALFSSIDEMEDINKFVPELCTMHCPEAVDVSLYGEGKQLKEREIDILEFGRGINDLNGITIDADGIIEAIGHFNHVTTRKKGNRFIYSSNELPFIMQDAKITICLPKSITHPEKAGGIETLTQRYWEAMLSRMVIIGHCPKELEILIGYNPVIEIPLDAPLNEMISEINNIITDVLINIDNYQELVDKNRIIALQYGNWDARMRQVMDWLRNNNYTI